jgi:hypothetical protein
VAIAASVLAYSELLEGNPDRARAGLELAWEYARSHPFTCAVVGAYEMLVPFTLGDAEETRTRADHVVSLSEEHGFAGQAAFGSFFRGWAIAMDDYESGVAAMDEAERRLCAVGNDVSLSARLLGVAEVQRRHGRPKLALIALDAADDFLQRSGERLQEPELHRLRGLLALDAGDEDLAGRAFERALASARTLGAPFFELRAATALATPARDASPTDKPPTRPSSTIRSAAGQWP